MSAVFNVGRSCARTCDTRMGRRWGGPCLQCRAESSRRREIGLEQTHYGKQLPGRGSGPAGPAAERLGRRLPGLQVRLDSGSQKGPPSPRPASGADQGSPAADPSTGHSKPPSSRSPLPPVKGLQGTVRRAGRGARPIAGRLPRPRSPAPTCLSIPSYLNSFPRPLIRLDGKCTEGRNSCVVCTWCRKPGSREADDDVDGSP